MFQGFPIFILEGQSHKKILHLQDSQVSKIPILYNFIKIFCNISKRYFELRTYLLLKCFDDRRHFSSSILKTDTQIIQQLES